MSKVVYIIPGFAEDVSQQGYQKVMEFFESREFKIIPVKITWKRGTMSEYVNEFYLQLTHSEKDEVYLFGFSFGAMIALISSAKVKPKTIFLCSLSPYFAEDLKYLKKSWRDLLYKRRTEDLKNFSFDTLTKNINPKVILAIGDKESSLVKRRVNDAYEKIKDSELYFLSNAKHDISQTEYFTNLIIILSTLIL